MIWLKRFTPVVIILAGWLFFHFYSTQNESDKSENDQKYALLTAQVWVATAKYRENPERFKEYRDSLLSASGLDNQQAIDYINGYKNKSDQLINFADLVNKYTDSLIAIEDSLLGIDRGDSLVLK